jgi:DNA-binding PadR family transcriptional regulator
MVSLENGILGFLSMKPLSGYDIKKLFKMSAAYFWPADQAQIYRTLKQLERDGLIAVCGIEHAAGPSKKLYSITENGLATLRGWLHSPKPSDFISRSPYLMQLFFSGLLSRDELPAFIDAQLAQNNALLDELRSNYIENKNAFTETTGLRSDSSALSSAVWTHRWGILSREAYAKLLEDIKAELESADI